jgi:hypothetical protein
LPPPKKKKKKKKIKSLARQLVSSKQILLPSKAKI